jgi:isopenicillin N synthase-like dioxygenase
VQSGVRVIPVLDLSQSNAALAPRLGDAFREIGFVALAHHGVPTATIDALYRAANAFFDMPAVLKGQVARPRPDQNRGYIAYGEETLARLGGAETPPDHKEIFSIGPFDLPNEQYYTSPAAYPSFAPNLWPACLRAFSRRCAPIGAR